MKPLGRMRIRCWLEAAFALLLVLGAPSALAARLTVFEQGPLPTRFHPFLLTSSPQGTRLSALVLERLGRVDAARNQLVLSFVQETKAKGPKSYELVLQPGLKWSDGSAMTAADIAASLSRLNQMGEWDNAPLSVKALARTLFLVESIEAAAPDRAVVHFRQPVQPHELPALLAMLPIIPKKLGDEQLDKPGAIGCGPFTLENATDGGLVLKANPHYYLGPPNIEGVDIKVLPQKELETALLDEGSGQLAVQVSATVLPTLRKKPELVLRPASSRRVLYLGFNGRSGSKFADVPELRMVVASLIDRQSLLDSVPDGGEARPLLTGPFAPDSPYADPQVESPAFSAPLARQRLATLGYRRVGENYRDSNGNPLRLRLLVSTSIPQHELLSRLIEEQLQREGLALEVKNVSPEAFQKLLLKPNGEFDLVMHEWLLDEGADVYEIFHSRGLYNYLGYDNPAVDERLVLERRATLPQSRILYRREIHRLLSRDLPMLFLWETHDVAVFRSDIERVPPLDPYFLYRDVYRWTIGGEVNEAQSAAAQK